MSTFGSEDNGKNVFFLRNAIACPSVAFTWPRTMSRNGIMLPGWIEHITQHLLTAFLVHLKSVFLNDNVVFTLDIHPSLSHSTVDSSLRMVWSTARHLNIHVQHLPYDRPATKMGLTHFLGAHQQVTNTSTVIDYALSPRALKNNQQVIEKEGKSHKY